MNGIEMIETLIQEAKQAERNGVKLIHYLDALPGVGKTKMAIEWMAMNTGGVSVYVAPRIKLLEEVAKRLVALKNKSEYLRDPKAQVAEKYGRTILVSSDRATAKGVSTAALLKEKLEGAVAGRIILCTHQAFVEASELDLELIENIQREKGISFTVFFDEARKLVLEQRDQCIAVTPQQRSLALKVLEPYASPVNALNGEYTGFSRYRVPRTNKVAVLKKMRLAVVNASSNGTDGIDSGEESDLVRFVESVCNPRLDVYVKRALELAEEEELTRRNRAVAESIYAVTSPARIFNGFQAVVMMSAYFRESQMYHLLKNSYRHCPDDGTRVELKEVKGVLDEKKKTIRGRLKQVVIFPLTSRETKMSITNLKHSCLVPREKLDEFYARVKEVTGIEPNNVYKTLMANDSWAHRKSSSSGRRSLAPTIRAIAAHTHGDQPLTDAWAYGRQLQWWRCGAADPVVGYFRMAQYVANQLRLHKGVSSGEFPYGHFVTGAPLVSLNKRALYRMREVLWHRAYGQRDMTITGYQNLHPDNPAWRRKARDEIADGVSIRDMLLREPTEEELDAENQRAERGEYLLGPRYEGDHGALGTEFDVVVADPMGLNGYRTRNFIAYLAARNPSPGIQTLLEALLPGYDPELDYAGESALQAVTRLSVRAPEREEKVYIVVPDLGLARIVQHKMSYVVLKKKDGRGQIRVRRGSKIDLSYSEMFDMADVLDAHKERFWDRSGSAKRKSSFKEEKKAEWPHDLVVLHNALMDPASKKRFLNCLSRGIGSKEQAVAFRSYASMMNDFCVKTDHFLGRHPEKHYGRLRSISRSRRVSINSDRVQKRLVESNQFGEETNLKRNARVSPR